MEIFNVEIKNGITLAVHKEVALDPYKIVKVNKWDTTKAHILYCRSMDRRDPADDLWLTETYAAVKVITDALTPPLIEYTQKNTDGTEEDVLVNPFFVQEIYAAKKEILGTTVSGCILKYTEGAFVESELFLRGNLLEVWSGTTTTTTTEVPATTTTTTEP